MYEAGLMWVRVEQTDRGAVTSSRVTDWGNMQKRSSMHHTGVKRKFYLIHVACTTAGKKGIFYSRLRHVLLFRGLPRLVKTVQSNKIHKVFEWVTLFSTYVSSTCFGPHRSIIRSVFYKLYSQIWHVVIRVLQFVLQLRKGWTCRVVRVLPHTKFAHTACKRRSW